MKSTYKYTFPENEVKQVKLGEQLQVYGRPGSRKISHDS